MIKQEQKAIFRKMEEVLYCYKKYSRKIEKDLENLEKPVLLRNYSLEKLGVSGYVEVKSDVERIEEYKARLVNDIDRCEEIMFRIDSALEMIKDNKDYNFIQMKYFDNMSYEKIAEELDTSLKSVYGMRNRILSALEIHFKTQRLIEF